MAEQFCSAGTLHELQWTLLFAREPEPDLDVELNEPGELQTRRVTGGAASPQPPPPSRVKILVLILLLVIVAGGTYVAMDPELMMKLTGQEATRSAPSTGAPARRVAPPPAGRPAPTVDQESSGLIAAPGAVPTPLFAEGDLVSVLPNPISPVMSLSLSQDAAGTRPGPTLSAGATLRVLDAELHENTWVYLVRSDSGIQGWVAEKQLRAKP